MSKRGDQIILSRRRDGKSFTVLDRTNLGRVPVGIVKPAETRSGSRWDACRMDGTVYTNGRALLDRDTAAVFVLASAETEN